MDTTQTNQAPDFIWPHEDTYQVPYRVYTGFVRANWLELGNGCR